jgi:hypothetical protein
VEELGEYPWLSLCQGKVGLYRKVWDQDHVEKSGSAGEL